LNLLDGIRSNDNKQINPKQNLTSGDQKIERVIIGILAGDGEVAALHCLPVLRRHELSNLVEALHGVLELLLQPVDHGGPGPVRGGTGSAAWQVPVGGVGAVESLELELDELGLLESHRNVAVHTRTEVLDGVGVVQRLALLVAAPQTLRQPLQLLQLLLHALHVLEELVEVHFYAAGSVTTDAGHLDDMVAIRRSPFAAEARE